MESIKDRFLRYCKVLWNEWFPRPRKSWRQFIEETETSTRDESTEMRFYDSKGHRVFPSFETWNKLMFERDVEGLERSRCQFLIQMKEGIATSEKPMIVMMYVRHNSCVYVFGFKSQEQWNQFIIANHPGQSETRVDVPVESFLDKTVFGVHFISFYQEIRPEPKNLETWLSTNTTKILGVETDLFSLGGQ